MDEETILKNIEKEVKNYLALTEKKQTGSKIPLMKPYYDHLEIMQVMDSLLKKNLTLNQSNGNKVQIFEDLWKDYIGRKEGILVNSGSSANLLALQLLRNPTLPNHIKEGSEIITPALTWTTTVSPIWSVGCKPVFVDVDFNNYTILPEEIEKAITPKTRAILLVHLLGYPCDMEKIMAIAKKHNLYVIEDCCEAHGSEFNGKKAGSFGDLATFSFFFSHHLTTIEGGMVLTDNSHHAEIIRTMRSQGVIRNCRNEDYKNSYFNNPKYKHIQKAYLFSNMGFNLRPTELNGGFGIEQFKKFPSILSARRHNAEFFIKEFSKWSDWLKLTSVPHNVKHAWFGMPIYVTEKAPFTRAELEEYLNTKGIETRQIMTGDVTSQPAVEIFESRTVGDLKNTKLIHKNAFFFGNHPGIGEQERQYVLESFKEFLSKYQ
jgi:CDP-6-deoxy-D-xylo-4-hexulose-3-dehydrase